MEKLKAVQSYLSSGYFLPTIFMTTTNSNILLFSYAVKIFIILMVKGCKNAMQVSFQKCYLLYMVKLWYIYIHFTVKYCYI